jgi:hypothetical protein
MTSTEIHTVIPGKRADPICHEVKLPPSRVGCHRPLISPVADTGPESRECLWFEPPCHRSVRR